MLGGDFVAKDDTTAASVVHHPRMVGLSLPVGVDGTVEGVDSFCVALLGTGSDYA